jgi:pyruvate dehydrogenase E2 component (dihydrolipoamide acetyltransferase)
MPKLTDTMEEGVVVSWKKREGESVAAGDVLAEIETDKAVMDLEAFGSGTLRKILAEPGETVKSGALIAVVAEADEDIGPALKTDVSPGHAAAPEPKPRPEAKVKAQAEVEPTVGEREGTAQEKGALQQDGAQHKSATRARPAGTKEQAEPVKASPRARTLAAERGIDLSTIQGTGPDGRITERDLPDATMAPVPGARSIERPLSQMRKAIARTMVQSKAPVPHFYLMTDIGMDEAERLRHQLKQGRRTHPSVTDLLIKAAALALARHPAINASYGGEVIRQHPGIDIGIAVGLDDGLITPVLRDCGTKSLGVIAREARDLIERARNKRLQPHEYTGATFTVSNLGMFDVENFIAVLVPPEAAALAIGAIRDVPVAEGGILKVGRRMKVTLSCDHRAVDGMQAAKFLQDLKRMLEHPLELIVPVEWA